MSFIAIAGFLRLAPIVEQLHGDGGRGFIVTVEGHSCVDGILPSRVMTVGG